MKIGLTLGFIFLWFTAYSCGPSASKRGSQAPDFSLPVFNESERIVRLSTVNAQGPVLLVFWATWCPSCIEEIPTLNKWQKESASKGLQIWSVNVEESSKTLTDFIESTSIDYPILLDEKGEVAGQFGLSGIPAAVLLAKGGEILYYDFTLPSNLDQLLEQRRV